MFEYGDQVGVSPNNVPIIPLVKLGRRSSAVMAMPKSPIRTSSPNAAAAAAAAALVAHPSGIPPSPRSSPQRPLMVQLQASAMAASFETDALELKIGLPQSPQAKNLSSQTSGAIRVI